MRGAFLIADGPEALRTIRDALVRLGADEVPGELLQLRHDDGYLFNVFVGTGAVNDAAWRQGVEESGQASSIPDVRSARAWWIECRSAELLAGDVKSAVATIPGRAWVLDDADVLWPAEAIDPKRIVL